jgi:aldose 1-epimerase
VSAASCVSCALFGRLADGRDVHAYTLANPNDVSVTILTLGGIVQSVRAPDREGRVGDIVLGFDTLAPYLDNRDYLGAVIGRCANRIARGRFRLDDRDYVLSRNDGENTLHGGAEGVDKALWNATVDGEGLLLTHTSGDGDQGFPGALALSVVYRLNGNNEFTIDYRARTSAPTVVNLTNHSYWRLSGERDDRILDHSLQIAADRFTPVDAHLIPLGMMTPVEGTALDLREPCRLRDVLGSTDPLIRAAQGLDHNFVLNTRDGPAARLFHHETGRVLEVFTSEPGLQVYSGNHLTAPGLRAWSGIALETQHFPDSPNQPGFPSTVLRPGELFRSSTIFRIGVV